MREYVLKVYEDGKREFFILDEIPYREVDGAQSNYTYLKPVEEDVFNREMKMRGYEYRDNQVGLD